MTASLPHRSRTTRRTALTLIELLVTMAALSLLLGQVVPAAKQVRQNSKELTCQDKLGQIAEAALAYAHDDASEFIIPIGKGDADTNRTAVYYAVYGFGGKSGVGPTGDVNSSIFGGRNWMGAVHRPLNTIVYKRPPKLPPGSSGSGRGSSGQLDWRRDTRLDLDIYRCPSDDGFSGMHHAGWKNSGQSAYDYYGASYAANCLLVARPTENWLKSNSPYRRPVSSIPNPANTVVYMENAARYAIYANNPEEHDQSASGCYWPFDIGDFTARGWHGTPFHFNVSFVDGRVAQVKIKGYGAIDLPSFPLPECDHGRCKCVVVRGPGYQLDTLPAPLLATPKFRVGAGMMPYKDGSGSIFDVVN